MKLTRSFVSLILCLSLSLFSFLSLTIQTTYAQDTKIAIQRGYRTGYSDGYMSGYRDAIENSTKDYARHNEYNKADRAYNKEYGALDEYKDGYQQGFETGYDTGFEKRSFDATLPLELNKRGVRTLAIAEKPGVETAVQDNTAAEVKPEIAENVSQPTDSQVAASLVRQNENPAPASQPRIEQAAYLTDNDAVIIIPTDTELIVELQDRLSTDKNMEGDKFKARIISPSEISGAIVEGRISKIRRPGRIKRRSEMLLSFDRIVLNEKRWSNFNAVLTEILPVRGDNVKLVDSEGTAIGRRNVKEDSVKVGATTGTGMVVGAIAGGPVGAAVGAGVGAAFGVGAVVIERGKNIRLNQNQQLRIKTSYETQIR
jgi:hypothetical protein